MNVLLDFWNKFRVKIILIALASIAVIGVSYYIYDLRHRNTALAQQNSTLQSEFGKLGVSYRAQGAAFKSEKEAEAQARKLLGDSFSDAMAKSNANIRVLYTAVAEVKDELKKLHEIRIDPDSNGGFANATLEQHRTGPSLSKVSLTYDPLNIDPSLRLTGFWTSYNEEFTTTVGEWVKQDNGYVAGIKMRRKVSKPLGNGAYTLVGEEDLPLVNGVARYSPIAFGGSQALSPVPRFSIYGGGGWDTDRKKAVPVLGMDFRVTTTTGIGAGIAGNVVFGTVSYRFGK